MRGEGVGCRGRVLEFSGAGYLSHVHTLVDNVDIEADISSSNLPS